ncbi:phosphoribosylformylglycinamidine synthase, partial [Candidatus Uhrbacteria bacterium]|nr:phosphoribosylformylglycinamidine synthase [Candidatus Uhrbacteria bacterium]
MVDVYTVDADLTYSQIHQVADRLTNPISQESTILSSTSVSGSSIPVGDDNEKDADDKKEDDKKNSFDWAIEIGFLPGVTDNIGSTVREMIEDLFKHKLPDAQRVYVSQITFLQAPSLTASDVKRIAQGWANPLIQRIHIKSREEFDRDHGMDRIVPTVKLGAPAMADVVDIIGSTPEQLQQIGKSGIENADGTRRGPLALSLHSMNVIQAYFKNIGRNPTDVELESIAQTWSEHCKHTIFASPLDEYPQGLYKSLIQKATNEIRKKKGKDDFCVSVFTDNSGVIAFDDTWLITDKAETHNSPSALDPFGGAITGIVGVNRDTIGCGLGAKPIINSYGYCVAAPEDTAPLYRDNKKTQPLLSPRTLLEGIISGVRVGGNCSGIPTTHGFVAFDHRYKGKPLVFVRTVGLMPRTSAGRPTTEKQAEPGDLIVMIGGRVGKDGIHGATFSSEALSAGSPATAVQIGDPITQKKISDAIVKEARDLGLYHSITDNGAGGLSCSVAEMAKESHGCHVWLETVVLKYPGLAPWETWISESQERMTLAVPPEHWQQFESLMRRRGVEATVIGEFTNTGRCVVQYNSTVVMDIDLEFLHNGVPLEELHCQEGKKTHSEPTLPDDSDTTATVLAMMSRLNIASTSFISQQYDHEVQSGSVVKPLQGRGRIQGDASVNRPLLDSIKGVVLSHGIYPTYSDISTYAMAAAAIDTAIRNAVAAGASLERIALMDNFCWCSSFDPIRLGQLKHAVKACYDVAVAYGTPFISGKDSMFNDFKGFDQDGKPFTLSIPPTLLVSSLAVMDDARSAMTLDAKTPGDLVYVLGETRDELGASEYYAMHDAVGANVPMVDTQKNIILYQALNEAIAKGVVASAQSVHRGGLAAALVKTAVGGMLGMDVALADIPGAAANDTVALWSESQG